MAKDGTQVPGIATYNASSIMNETEQVQELEEDEAEEVQMDKEKIKYNQTGNNNKKMEPQYQQ